MQRKEVNELLQTLIDIPSVTGSEAEVGIFLAEYLESQGFEVQRLPVEGERMNVFATVGVPKIILQAHMDVVPPHIPAREDDIYVYGRGACDTKGSIASMVVAAQQALSENVTDFGLLFTVGEEVDFAGAKHAQSLVEESGAFLVVGEPTQLKPVVAHYGIAVFSLVCTGVAAHSSEPQLGDNAIDKLVAVLNGPAKKLQVKENTLMSIVRISGGVADNIIPERAEALFSFRIAPGDTTDYAPQLQALVGDRAEVQKVQSLPPVASAVPESLSFLGEGQSVKYCTELTFLKNGLVFGPGSIADAHKPTEKVKKADLQTAVATYQRVLREYRA